MKDGLPVALILGSGHFVAGKLIEKLKTQDIRVKENAESYDGTENYIFDFEGNQEIWDRARENNIKITMVVVNDEDRAKEMETRVKKESGNIRMVKTFGVYGAGMEGNDFLAEAFEEAVKNKNLTLPILSLSYRLLAVDDLVEAILRANFLSGTEGEVFLVVGEETNSETVAGVLIDKAKMTKRQVNQSEIGQIGPIGPMCEKKEVEENWRKLRWKPEIEFKDGIEETLQYFFVKADEESRKPKLVVKPVITREVVKKYLEVEVENLNPSVLNLPDPVDTGSTLFEKEGRDQGEVEEPKFEIKPIVKMPRVKVDYKKEETIEETENENVDRRSLIVEPSNLNLPSPTVVGETLFEKEGREQKKPKKKKGPAAAKALAGKWVLICLMVGGILFFPTKWIGTLVLLKKSVSASELLIKAGKFDEAVIVIDKRMVSVKTADEQITDWGLNKIPIVRNLQELLRMGDAVLSLEKKAIEVGEQTTILNKGLFGEENVDWARDLGKLFQLLLGFEGDVGMLEARVSGNTKWLPPRFRDEIKNQLKTLTTTRDNIAILRQFFPAIPEFIGTDNKRREYLVLLQNETELRATGGFIGSFGILSFQNGKMLNFEVKDVYEADGQLKGHVEPPSEIKEYLGEAAWFLRDANWQPDFGGAAKDVEWFLEKETGRKVDGVIGMNLAVAKAILGVIGEVDVPDYKEKINKDNLYQQAEFYSEEKFFPGSGQKASFLSGLGKQLFEEIKNLDSERRVKLLEAMIGELESNDVQLALNNKEAAAVVAGLGWDGSIAEGKCSTDRCVADYTFINESNFGVNKANYFVQRNIVKTVEIGENKLSRVLKINYENTAKSLNYPGGNYKNYLRVYLPSDINLESITVTDGDNKNKIEVIEGGKLRMDERYGKKELGFLVTVPVSGKRTVEIKYSSVIAVNSDKFSYLDYIQRQSGSGETGVIETVGYPKNYQPLQVEPVATVEGDKIVFEMKLEKDLKVGVEIGK